MVYRIQLGPRAKPKVVHHNRLWKYSGDNPPSWLSPSSQVGANSIKPQEKSPQNMNAIQKEDELDLEDSPRIHPEPRRSSRPRRPPDRYASKSCQLPKMLPETGRLQEGGDVETVDCL